VDDASWEDDDKSVEIDDTDDEFLDEDKQFSARRYKDYHVYHSEAKAVENVPTANPCAGQSYRMDRVIWQLRAEAETNV
jgi:hypothetical protein